MEADMGIINAGGYHAVTFSYGNIADPAEQKNDDKNSEVGGFCPPFPVPENLAHSLPSSEKVHQIIARTALFVSQHGGQSEIVLRVKQGDNPTFGFLMPHHHLHPYFRYLVDHPDILNASSDGNSQKGNNTDNQSGSPGTGGALSLLGSVYGSVEDEDVVPEDPKELASSSGMDSVGTTTAGDLISQCQSKKQDVLDSASQKLQKSSKLLRPSKEKASIISSTAKLKSSKNGKENALSSSSADVNNSKLCATSSAVNGELLVIEPPSELKRLVDRIVEIILKNGQGFEALLIEQDKNHGRFPFLLSSNQYHPYYKKFLRMAQESRVVAKSFGSDKDATSWQGSEKKTGQSKQSDESLVQDLPFDYDKKEKFKMVITKTKKEIQEQPSKEPQQPPVEISADAAAAILQAATRGIKKPSLDILSKNLGPGAPVSEAGLTKEQKLKAERLKRAKVFAAMIKSGVTQPLGKDREGSSAPADVGTSHKIEKNPKKCLDKRHYRSKNQEEQDDKEGDQSDRHSRKKHRSRHSPRHHRDDSRERHRHGRRHSSSKDREDQHHHRRHHHKLDKYSSSEDEYERCNRRRKHKKRSNPEERDLEEGEIRAKSSDQSLSSVADEANKEKSLDTEQEEEEERAAPSEQPHTTVVPDDLRAKIRAMLLATL